MNENEFLFVEEIAARMRTSVPAVRAWLRQGRMPSLRVGRRLLVRRVDLDRMIESAARPSAAA